MRVLFINSIQMFGGGEIWMLRTMVALRQRGVEVALCCRPDTELNAKARQESLAVLNVNFRFDYDPFNVLRLAYYLWRNRIDIVLTNMDKELRSGGLAARLAGVPAVIPRRGIDYPLKDRLRYRFAYNRLATAIIANSIATKNALLKNAPWLQSERIHVIYNGIDLDAVDLTQRLQIRRNWGVNKADPVIGFVGQLDERKGIADLLRAFHQIRVQVPQVRLVLAGEGKLRPYVEQQILQNQWQEQVNVLGFVDEVMPLMGAFDLLLLPSYWEGFGIVLIEAMAAGTPVISTNTSSMPEIVSDGKTGYLVPPGDSVSLAIRAVELLVDNEKRQKFGQAARRRVERLFTIDRMVTQLIDLFEQQAKRRTWLRR